MGALEHSNFSGSELRNKGSIVRVRMKDFMQYADMTFEPGPCLNVIIGPNGSGKSTIVNAICLGVAGKAKFLDRAKDPREFIREGQESAEIHVDLFVESGSTLKISRKWSKTDSRTYWSVNGSPTTLKSVEALVRDLKIQVENLCQFLPQDKVQNFSRMDAKTLLDSTVEAVGEGDLKEKHQKLKGMQKVYEGFEDQYRVKHETLAQNKASMERMDGDVKNYHEKLKVDLKIELFKKKKLWLQYCNKKAEVREINEERRHKEESISAHEESEIKPIKESIKKIKLEKDEVTAFIRDKLSEIRQYVTQSRNYSHLVENLKNEYTNCDEELEGIRRSIRDREENIEALTADIQSIEATIAKEEEEGEGKVDLLIEFNKASDDLAQISADENEIDAYIKAKEREKRNAEASIKSTKEEIERLNDVDSIKLDKLKTSFPDGKDVLSARNYLRSNYNDIGLLGKVYDPIVIILNVPNPSHALYLENTIQARDLVAFCAEETQDVNAFVNVLRKDKKYKVNAIKVDKDADLNILRPKISSDKFPPNCNFRGYVSDLFDAPAPIKSYLCKTYNLHNTAVFGSVSSEVLNFIVNDLKLNNFFIENERYSVVLSSYSNERSSNSFTARSRNWIQNSAEMSKVSTLKSEIKKLSDECTSILDEIKEKHSNLKEVRIKKEETTQRTRRFNQRLNFVKGEKNRLELKKRNLSDAMRKVGSGSEEEIARKECDDRKVLIVRKIVEANEKLFGGINQHADAKIRLELEKLRDKPLEDEHRSQVQKLQEAEEMIKSMKKEVETKKGEAKRIMKEAEEYRTELEKMTGHLSVTDELKELWNEHKVPDDLHKVEEDIDILESESACLGNVNRSVVDEYLKLKESCTNLESELSRKEEESEKQKNDIDALKNEWLSRINSLVDNIDSKFRANFAAMGYAGQIELKAPQGEDFDGYGIEIYVKYRENVKLAKLTPHLQSGGERSVATALYMMSLQELTVVPFRCVDEINQGMDSANERKVFDLLMKTSSREDYTAQYLLLTPKLLPNLVYNDRVKIHVVYNGAHVAQCPSLSAGEVLRKIKGLADNRMEG